MKSSIYVAILIAALAIVPLLSHPVLAQGAAGFDRNSCIQNCAWLKPFGYNYGQYMNYYNCVARCESRFWQEFDRNSRELEEDLK
ncbi:MAG TPA: hypothetical protein VMC85_23650 [Desulfomonilaceae bacterium]|nr:hypothetical protein [Desulfomonilaceae bacterium]